MDIAVDVMYEDNHLVVLNKQTGYLVQGDKTGDTPLVEACKAYIKRKYQKPGAVFLGVVHRLDRPVSGLVVFARTSKALSRMNALFRNKETTKVYWAIVTNSPSAEDGNLVHWLKKDTSKNKTTAYHQEKEGALRSELSYKILANISGDNLMEVRPITGRSHQIRVQLAALGCPIAGDTKYGYPKPNPDMSICLHARQLSFVHPVKKEQISLIAPVPDINRWKKFRNFE